MHTEDPGAQGENKQNLNQPTEVDGQELLAYFGGPIYLLYRAMKVREWHGDMNVVARMLLLTMRTELTTMKQTMIQNVKRYVYQRD